MRTNKEASAVFVSSAIIRLIVPSQSALRLADWKSAVLF